jgi:hypothetical protein
MRIRFGKVSPIGREHSGAGPCEYYAVGCHGCLASYHLTYPSDCEDRVFFRRYIWVYKDLQVTTICEG